MFVKHSYSGEITTFLVHIDDIIMTGNDEKKIHILKQMAKEFKIKELGRLKYFLGIEIAHSKKEIFLSQLKYVIDILK